MYKNIFFKQIIKKDINLFWQALNGIYKVVYIINTQGVYLCHSYITDDDALKYQIPKKFVGKNLWDLFPKKIADMYFNFALDTIYKDKVQNLNETYSTTGIIHKELFYNEPLKDTQNNIIGVIGKVINVEFLKNKTNFINQPKYLKKNDDFNKKFSEITFLLKKIEDNPTDNNFTLIQKIKGLLKSCCNIIIKDAVNHAQNYKLSH